MNTREIVVNIEELLVRVNLLENKMKSVQSAQSESETSLGTLKDEVQALATRVDALDNA